MKIGIDGVPLTIPFPCGTKHYSEQLLDKLAKIDKRNEYLIFASERAEVPNQNNFRLIKIPSFIPVLKRQLFLAYFAKKEKVDVFHYLEPYGAIFFRHPNIVTTVHDLNLGKTYPFLSKYAINKFYCKTTRSAVFANTKAFITVSKEIKKELSTFLKRLDKKVEIHVIHNAVNNRFKLLPRSKKRGKYFLGMGDFAPRKNVPRVIETYSLLPDKIRDEFGLKALRFLLPPSLHHGLRLLPGNHRPLLQEWAFQNPHKGKDIKRLKHHYRA